MLICYEEMAIDQLKFIYYLCAGHFDHMQAYMSKLVAKKASKTKLVVSILTCIINDKHVKRENVHVSFFFSIFWPKENVHVSWVAKR